MPWLLGGECSIAALGRRGITCTLMMMANRAFNNFPLFNIPQNLILQTSAPRLIIERGSQLLPIDLLVLILGIKQLAPQIPLVKSSEHTPQFCSRLGVMTNGAACLPALPLINNLLVKHE
jgi:hypothetical protein